MMRTSTLVLMMSGLVLALWVVAPGCTFHSPVSEGEKDGPCYGNGTCNQSLVCQNGFCKAAEATPDSGSTEATPDKATAPPDAAPDLVTSPDLVTAADQPSSPPDATTTTESAPEAVAEVPAGKFSFFVTSLEAMQKLSGSKDGFGGNLGGLAGADKICQTIAAGVGYGHKTWRAFLSATKGPDGNPVHAIERIGKGPWYDRNERLIAENVAGLPFDRPKGDAQAVQDLANEHGQGQHQFGDNHDTMTGTNKQGKLNSTDPASTCQDWTSAVGPGTEKKVMCGHSWPRGLGGGGGRGGANWMSDHTLRGCTPGVNLIQNGGGTGDCVGCSGGYGGIYCFALTP